MANDASDRPSASEVSPNLEARMERLERRLQALEDQLKEQAERRTRRQEAFAALERGDEAAAEKLFPGQLDRLKKMQAKRAQRPKGERRKKR